MLFVSARLGELYSANKKEACIDIYTHPWLLYLGLRASSHEATLPWKPQTPVDEDQPKF